VIVKTLLQQDVMLNLQTITLFII